MVLVQRFFLHFGFEGSGSQTSLAPSLEKSVMKKKTREFATLCSSRPEVANWSAFFLPFSLMIVFFFLIFNCLLMLTHNYINFRCTAPSFLYSFLPSLPSGSCVPLTYLHQCGNFYFVLNAFLLFCISRCSRLVLYVPVLK